MTEDEVLSEFRAADALLSGHFLLSSGRHSGHYLQCARVLMDPSRASRLVIRHAPPMGNSIHRRTRLFDNGFGRCIEAFATGLRLVGRGSHPPAQPTPATTRPRVPPRDSECDLTKS